MVRSIGAVECALVFGVRKSSHSVNKEIHILFLFAKTIILWSREGTMMDKCTALADSHYPLWNKHGSGQHSSFHFNTITCLQASKFPVVQSCTVLLKLLKKLWLTLIAMAMRIGSLSRILQFDLFFWFKISLSNIS